MDLIDREHLMNRLNGSHPGWTDLIAISSVVNDEPSIDPLTELLKWIDSENPQSVKSIVHEVKLMLGGRKNV